MIRASLETSDRRLFANSTRGPIMVSHIVLANTTSARRTVRVHHCTSGETGGASNALLYDATMSANSSIILDMPFFLAVGEEIRGKADAAGVTMTIQGPMA